MAEAVSSETFDREVLQASEPVLVDFWATWCAPCRALAPTIEKLSADYSGRLRVRKLDVDEAPEVAGKYGIQSIPTVVLFQDGKEVTRWIGAQRLPAYTQQIDQLLTGAGANRA